MIRDCKNCRNIIKKDMERGCCMLNNTEVFLNGYCAKWKPIEENPKVAIHKDICESLSNIYEKKNSDYGDSFSKLRIEYGNTAILIRLEDKLGRLKRLMQGSKQQVKDESIDDSLKDLANYAIMELVERRIESESK